MWAPLSFVEMYSTLWLLQYLIVLRKMKSRIIMLSLPTTYYVYSRYVLVSNYMSRTKIVQNKGQWFLITTLYLILMCMFPDKTTCWNLQLFSSSNFNKDMYHNSILVCRRMIMVILRLIRRNKRFYEFFQKVAEDMKWC